MGLHVAGLWRYPVKTLAGEHLSATTIGPQGIPGDRIVRVLGPEGVRTSRRHYRLLGLRGTSDANGHPLVDGHVGGVHGLDEVDWPGAELHIGQAIVRLDSRRGRCPMTTVDPDTLRRDPEVLRDIGRRFGGRLALNADVARAGTIRAGDPVRLVRDDRADADD